MRKVSKGLVMRIALAAMALLLILCTVVACNKAGSVTEIEVVEESNAGFYMLEGFNISTLKLRVKYDNDTTNVINVEMSMLNTETRNQLKTSGQKEITINYQGKTTTVSFYLAEEGEQLVEVTFRDMNGNKIGSVKALLGDSVQAPEPEEIEGMSFRGWVDTEDNIVDLSNVQTSMTVTASYTTSVTKYSVRFYDYLGNLVKEDRIEEGGNVYAPTYNKPAEVKSYTWNATFPITVVKDENIRMSVEYQYYSVDYVYAYEASRNDITDLKLHEDVKYGDTAKNFNTAKNKLPGTLVESPIDPTTIYKNTTFLFILASERVSITVYNNEDMTQVKVDAKEYLINSQYTFPIQTANAVAGKNFAGWKLYDGSKYSKGYASGSTWKVDLSYGKNIKVVPYYTTAYAYVTMEYIFTDIAVEGGNFSYRKIIDDRYETRNSSVSYDDIAGYLDAIKASSGNEVNDGSAAGLKAKNAIANYEIKSVSYGNDRILTVGSSVRVDASELYFNVYLDNVGTGTNALTYRKVLVVHDRPELTLPAGDKITGFKYGSVVIPCFPYVVTPYGVAAETWDYSDFVYTTELTNVAIDHPGYYLLTVETGATIPQSGWFIKNDRGNYVNAANTQTVVQSGTEYYGYYYAIGYEVAEVTPGSPVTAKTYYEYKTETGKFALTADTIFGTGKTYYTCVYKEDTNEYNSGYYYGYEVTGINVEQYTENTNIYMPDTRTEIEAGNEVTRPVVSVGENAFAPLDYIDWLDVDYVIDHEKSYTYIIAGLPQNLICVRDLGLFGVHFYNANDFSSCTSVGDYAFAYAGLTGTTVFRELTDIGYGAFARLNFFEEAPEAQIQFTAAVKSAPESMFGEVKGKLSVAFTMDTLEEIGDSAFAGAEGLEALTGIGHVKDIGPEAFYLTAITELDFPNAETIGDYAFRDMKKLTSLSLGGNGTLTQTTIDLSIVDGCKQLVELIIGKQDAPQASAAAGEGAKEKVKNLNSSLSGTGYLIQTIGLPASVERISSGFFDKFIFMERVIVPASCENFYTDDGVLYSIDNTVYEMYYYPVNKPGNYTPTLPSKATVFTLSASAFGDAVVTMLDLTGITCDITIKNQSAETEIYGIKVAITDKMTVNQLSSLGNVYLSTTKEETDRLVALNDWDEHKVFSADAFSYYYDEDSRLLFTLDAKEGTAGVLKGYRFADSIVVPATVTVDGVVYTVNAIYTKAFYGFTNLQSLDVQATLYIFPEGVFGDTEASCSKLDEMSFYGWDNRNDENEIKAESFMYTSWYSSHTIIYAGQRPFGYNADAIDQEITAAELTECGFSTTITANFFKDAVITSIAFPESITKIEEGAFKGCALLTDVSFNRVSSIGKEAFAGCIRLKEADVPLLTEMDNSAFSGCGELLYFRAPALKRMPVKAFENCSKMRTVELTGLEAFAADTQKNSHAFSNCASLISIELPSFRSDSIPGHTFHGCSSLRVFDFAKLSHWTSTGVEASIGVQAFYDCSALEYVQFGTSVVKIEEGAFENCPVLTVEIPYGVGGLYIPKPGDLKNGYYTAKSGDITGSISENAFDDDTDFYIENQVNAAETFLHAFPSSQIHTIYPTVTFEFLQDGNVDYTKYESTGLNDITDRIYFDESDLVPASLSGLKFIGWSESSASYQPVNFPLIVTADNKTLYARYISTLRGTLDNEADVDYVYLALEAPKVDLDSSDTVRKISEESLYNAVLAPYYEAEGETRNKSEFYDEAGYIKKSTFSVKLNTFKTLCREAGYENDEEGFLRAMGVCDEWNETIEWRYSVKRGGAEIKEGVITSFPFILHDVTKEDSVELFAWVTTSQYAFVEGNNSDCIQIREVRTKLDFSNIYGEFGYAIINYSGTDSKNVVLPEIYSDGVNTGDEGLPIIALYAGAFGGSLNVETVTLPAQLKVIMKGYYKSNEFSTEQLTFNNSFIELAIPDTVEYIEDGLFNGLANLEKVEFGARSNLIYVTRESFLGTKWYSDSVVAAESGANNGFVMAGRTAIEYVGRTSSVFIVRGAGSVPELEYSDRHFAIDWTLVQENGLVKSEQEINVRIYNLIGEYTTVKYRGTDGTLDELNGLYTITLKADGKPDIILTVHSKDSGSRRAGEVNTVTFSAVEGTVESFRFMTGNTDSVTLPQTAIKIVDGIFKGDAEMVKIVINNELVYIGAEAFSGTGLTSIGYTDRVENSKLKYIGENAFLGTPFYTSSSDIIVGTVYLKYNNTGAGIKYEANKKKVVASIPAYITAIAPGAFENISGLGSVIFNGNNVTEIGLRAFAGSGIERIELPASLLTIHRGAFMNCSALIEVNLSKTKLTEIGQDMFFGCTSLTHVTLPASVEKFSKNTFRKAKKLSMLTGAGVKEVDVGGGYIWENNVSTGNNDGSSLIDTAFYSPTQTKEDHFVIIGSVLVKYVIGSTNLEKLQTGEKIEIEIPDTIVTILSKAFYKNDDISVVSIPSSVEVIGQSAFEKCSMLEKVIFSAAANVKTIETSAFKDCTKLKTIELPANLEKIGPQAFYMTSITTKQVDESGVYVGDEGFTIPASVKEIDTEAFYGVSTLTILNLGDNLEKIGENAFHTGYTKANGSTVDGEFYKVVWNVTVMPRDTSSSFLKLSNYIKETTGDVARIFSSGSGIVIRFYFPTSAMENAIEEHKDLWNTSESDVYSFICVEKDQKDDKSYPKITLQSGENSDEIYAEILYENTLKDKIRKINGQTFVNWTYTVEGGERVLTFPFIIKQNALILTAKYVDNNPSVSDDYTCISGSITSVNDGVTTLYVPDKFGGTVVKSISLDGPNTDVTEIVLTKAENFNGLTENIFANYTNLEKISVPNDIDAADFVIKTVTLTYEEGEGDDKEEKQESYQVIYSSDEKALIAFIGRAKTGMRFVVPDTVTAIYDGAFINSGLETIYLPGSVETIGDNAFNKEIKNLQIANSISLKNVSYTAFSDRGTGSFWQTSAASTGYESYSDIRGLKVKITSSNGDELGDAFILGNIILGYSYRSGTDLNMSEMRSASKIDVTVLASNVFALPGSPAVSFKTIQLPSSIKQINAGAFNNCQITVGIAENTIGDTKYMQLKDIADDVFKGKTFYINANSSMLVIGRVLVKATYTASRITVPEGIVTIMKDAFNNSQVTEVVLPTTLEKIGESAFYGASKLTKIEIKNNVKIIGKNAFSECTKLSKVEIDTMNSSLNAIGDGAFLRCVNLESIKLPYNLTEIGQQAFFLCTKLSSVTFDGYAESGAIAHKSNLTTIGASAFSGCSDLVSISIPDGVERIENNTFQNCTKLSSVEFDVQYSKLTSIGKQAFFHCESLGKNLTFSRDENDVLYIEDLVTLHLPNALRKVEDYAFEGCSSLWGVQFNYNIDELGSEIFKGCNNLVKVVIYRSTTPKVNSNTFEIGIEANYRLRIYVMKSVPNDVDMEYGPVMENYINQWSDVTINNQSVKYYLYERGDMPRVTFNIGGEPTVTTAEVIVNPYVSGISADRMIYSSVSQASSWVYNENDSNYTMMTDTNRTTSGSTVSNYGMQRYNYSGTDVYLLIVDYDEIIISSSVSQ